MGKKSKRGGTVGFLGIHRTCPCCTNNLNKKEDRKYFFNALKPLIRKEIEQQLEDARSVPKELSRDGRGSE